MKAIYELSDMTQCLRSTIWSILPFVVLYLWLPFHIRALFRSQSRDVPLTALSIAKAISLIFLFAIAVMDLCFWLLDRDGFNAVDVADPSLRLLTFGPLLGLLFFERRRGFRISPLQCGVFSVFLATSLLPLYSHIKEQVEGDEESKAFPAGTFIASFVFILVSFVCHFFVEGKPAYSGPDAPEDTPKPCPEILASCPSKLTFSWFTGFAWTGVKRTLVATDLWDLAPAIRSRRVVARFNRHWEKLSNSINFVKSASGGANATNASFTKTGEHVQIKTGSDKKKSETKGPQISIYPSLVKTFGAAFAIGSVFKLVQDLMLFASPILQQFLIQFVKDPSKPLWQGLFLALCLLLATTVQTLLISQYFYRMYIVGIWVRAAVTSAVYRKALRVSQTSKKDITTGEIVNLMSVDVQRLVDMMPYINMIWSSPMQIAGALFFLWLQLGPSVLAGLLVMILLIPVNGAIAAKSRSFQIAQMKQKDQRVKMMNEILQGMKILKLFAWEESFEKVIADIRGGEIKILTKMAYLQAGSSFIWSSAPFVVSLVTFATYVLVDENNVLDAEKAFVSLSLFNILRFPLSMLPMMIAGIVQANVSVKRINKFMNAEEVDVRAIEHVNKSGGDGANNAASTSTSAKYAIRMDEASFTWDREAETPTIKDVTLDVEKGKLVAVVGTVGSGKSSLVSSVLGELEKIEGRVVLDGSVAYVAQQAWIQNETLKNNILFNLPYDEAKYNRCLDACALRPDLEVLPGGDATEIGEKGINLSGGQKQRVSLARALYCDADIYLMDDPLSAVDSHVGKHIFEQVLGPSGCLKDKTRVLVTHGIAFLPKVDNIVVLKEGSISETGTYQELLDHKGAFSEFLMQFITSMESGEGEEAAADDEELAAIKDTLEHTLGKEELQRNLSRLRSQDSECSGSGRERHASITSNGSNKSAAGGGKGTPARNGSLKSKDGSPVKRSRSKSADKVGDGKPAGGGGGEGEKKGQQQYAEEKSEAGMVQWAVYLFYIKSMGLALFAACVVFFTLYQFASSGARYST